MFNTLIFLAFLCREQPPSGGCVLKLLRKHKSFTKRAKQPPSGGCVLKQDCRSVQKIVHSQPPSGGCVLKLKVVFPEPVAPAIAATFGWLCVETMDKIGGVIDRIKSSHLRVAVC